MPRRRGDLAQVKETGVFIPHLEKRGLRGRTRRIPVGDIAAGQFVTDGQKALNSRPRTRRIQGFKGVLSARGARDQQTQQQDHEPVSEYAGSGKPAPCTPPREAAFPARSGIGLVGSFRH